MNRVIGSVRHLFHYPVKGLSPQPLPQVRLVPGHGFPFDRMYGLARFDSGFDSAAPQPLPKQRFLMLARDARLARLQTWLDTSTHRFTVHQEGKLVHEAMLDTAEGAASTVKFFSALFGFPPEQQPMVARADPHRFTDVSVGSPRMMNAISLISLASVRDFGERIGKHVDPLRFRGNLYFDGWTPWSEFELLDREICVGEARLRILKRTQRCAATEVNPRTAERDIAVPRELKAIYGHFDMGVYAEVLEGGAIEAGTPIQALAE